MCENDLAIRSNHCYSWRRVTILGIASCGREEGSTISK